MKSSTAAKNAPLSPRLILDIIRDLTVGQRQSWTQKKLATFLHDSIFPRFAPYVFEIYFHTSDGAAYSPHTIKSSRYGKDKVPESFARDSKLVKSLLSTPSPIQINETTSHPELAQSLLENHLVVAITNKKKLPALLYAGTNLDSPFTDDFISSVQTIADIIGSRLQSMEIIHQQQQSMEDLEYSERVRAALNEISETADKAVNINSLYARVHRIVSDLIHAPNFYIAIIKEKEGRSVVSFPYYADDHDPHFQGMELCLDQHLSNLSGYVIKSQQPLLLTPYNYDIICAKNRLKCLGTKPHSWVGSPFSIDHNIAGIVAIQSYAEVIYTTKDKDLLTFVARHIGSALGKKRRMDQLEEAKERAERAEKNMSTFLANMSHEIRTPMNGIMGLIDLVLDSEISESQRVHLDMVSASADRLLCLINDILDFSKIEAGKVEVAKEPFQIRKIIAEAIEILALTADAKDLKLTAEIDSEVPVQLFGDGGKLSQVLINLVGNGIKFTQEGGVVIRVEQTAAEEELVELSFEVADTGIGIPKDKLSNVFEAFNQLGTTRDSSNRGTGLGLVIAAELVELMGGRISLESAQGIGTTFSFTLLFSPVLEDGIGIEAKTPAPPAKTFTRNLNILLVEDEYINRTLGVSVLEKEGWRVTTAENGLEAVLKYEETDFDLILMDIQMPELNGFEATDVIRKNESTKGGEHMPIIAMTAYAVNGDRERCLQAGMDGYVAKPIRPEILRNEIETVLLQVQQDC